MRDNSFRFSPYPVGHAPNGFADAQKHARKAIPLPRPAGSKRPFDQLAQLEARVAHLETSRAAREPIGESPETIEMLKSQNQELKQNVKELRGLMDSLKRLQQVVKLNTLADAEDIKSDAVPDPDPVPTEGTEFDFFNLPSIVP
ncbi:hypothetical protein FE257_002201 [Aspergillus nanangensis]|uniref:Uncharacterized protein n=1 Tax=Aspergillus nanangensis TaxID=2582783 RepID=A0AAD4CD19_ASPNN|nr:hypothetical protein FE257_002201 [Aspergillus nanangensis]